MLHCVSAGDGFMRKKCSCCPDSVLHEDIFMCWLPVCMYICLSCVVLCWKPVGMAGVIRASLQLSFTRSFVSVRLLFLLSAARCYNPWPRPAKSVSLSSRSTVVGLCVSVAKQQLACSHTELCVMQSCRGRELSQTHTHLKNYIHTHTYNVCTSSANFKQIPQPV